MGEKLSYCRDLHDLVVSHAFHDPFLEWTSQAVTLIFPLSLDGPSYSTYLPRSTYLSYLIFYYCTPMHLPGMILHVFIIRHPLLSTGKQSTKYIIEREVHASS